MRKIRCKHLEIHENFYVYNSGFGGVLMWKRHSTKDLGDFDVFPLHYFTLCTGGKNVARGVANA